MAPCPTLLPRLHLPALQMGKREGKMMTLSIGDGAEGWAVLGVNTRSQTGNVCHRALKACISLDPAIPLLGIYPKEMISNVQYFNYKDVHSLTVFVIA